MKITIDLENDEEIKAVIKGAVLDCVNHQVYGMISEVTHRSTAGLVEDCVRDYFQSESNAIADRAKSENEDPLAQFIKNQITICLQNEGYARPWVERMGR